ALRNSGKREDLVQELRRRLIRSSSDRLAMNARDERFRDRLPIHHEGPEAIRIEHHPDDVRRPGRGRRSEQEAKKARGCVVAGEDIPGAIHHHRGIWLLLAEDRLERGTHRAELRRIELRLLIRWGIASRQQEEIAFTEGYV